MALAAEPAVSNVLPGQCLASRRRLFQATPGYAMFLIFGVPWALFTLYPLVKSVILSFQSATAFGSGGFVGLGNYNELLHDGLWWSAVARTLAWASVVVVARTLIAVVLAAALVKCGDGTFTSTARAVLFWPYVLSVSVVTIIWGWLANPQFGILTGVVHALGGPELNWLSSGLAFWLLVLVKVWWWLGFSVLIVHAGMIQIPGTQYEAAQVDGASYWQQFRRITVPFIVPQLEFIVVVGIAQELQVFALPQILTGGGPGYSTYMALQDFYTTAFQDFKLGYASAMALCLTVIAVALALIARRVARAANAFEAAAR